MEGVGRDHELVAGQQDAADVPEKQTDISSRWRSQKQISNRSRRRPEADASGTLIKRRILLTWLVTLLCLIGIFYVWIHCGTMLSQNCISKLLFDSMICLWPIPIASTTLKSATNSARMQRLIYLQTRLTCMPSCSIHFPTSATWFDQTSRMDTGPDGTDGRRHGWP